eukprot:scaffold421236_cov58-Attheya_sp.AAC.5
MSPRSSPTMSPRDSPKRRNKPVICQKKSAAITLKKAQILLQKLAKSTEKGSPAPPKVDILPRGIGPIAETNVNDVLCGRGGKVNSHPGNRQFREIVEGLKEIYLAKTTKKLEKAHVAAQIIITIRTMDPPGRFLKEDSNDGMWYDIGDIKARKKAGQALREDAPEMRDEDDSSNAKPKTKPTPKKKASPASDTKRTIKRRPSTAPSISSDDATDDSSKSLASSITDIENQVSQTGYQAQPQPQQPFQYNRYQHQPFIGSGSGRGLGQQRRFMGGRGPGRGPMRQASMSALPVGESSMNSFNTHTANRRSNSDPTRLPRQPRSYQQTASAFNSFQVSNGSSPMPMPPKPFMPDANMGIPDMGRSPSIGFCQSFPPNGAAFSNNNLYGTLKDTSGSIESPQSRAKTVMDVMVNSPCQSAPPKSFMSMAADSPKSTIVDFTGGQDQAVPEGSSQVSHFPLNMEKTNCVGSLKGTLAELKQMQSMYEDRLKQLMSQYLAPKPGMESDSRASSRGSDISEIKSMPCTEDQYDEPPLLQRTQSLPCPPPFENHISMDDMHFQPVDEDDEELAFGDVDFDGLHKELSTGDIVRPLSAHNNGNNAFEPMRNRTSSSGSKSNFAPLRSRTNSTNSTANSVAAMSIQSNTCQSMAAMSMASVNSTHSVDHSWLDPYRSIQSVGSDVDAWDDQSTSSIVSDLSTDMPELEMIDRHDPPTSINFTMNMQLVDSCE